MRRNNLNASFLCLFRRVNDETYINEVRAEVERVFGDGTIFKHTVLRVLYNSRWAFSHFSLSKFCTSLLLPLSGHISRSSTFHILITNYKITLHLPLTSMFVGLLDKIVRNYLF